MAWSEISPVSSELDCHWSTLITWPEYWPLIGQYAGCPLSSALTTPWRPSDRWSSPTRCWGRGLAPSPPSWVTPTDNSPATSPQQHQPAKAGGVIKLDWLPTLTMNSIDVLGSPMWGLFLLVEHCKISLSKCPYPDLLPLLNNITRRNNDLLFQIF